MRWGAWWLGVVCAGCILPPAVPPAPDPRLPDAEAAVLAEDWSTAEQRFTAIAETPECDPEGAGAVCRYWIGVCRREQGDPAGARRAFGRALASRDPEWQARTRMALGDLAWAARDWGAAREMYTSAAADQLPVADQERRADRLDRGREPDPPPAAAD